MFCFGVDWKERAEFLSSDFAAEVGSVDLRGLCGDDLVNCDRTARRRGEDALFGVDHLIGILFQWRYFFDVVFLVGIFR